MTVSPSLYVAPSTVTSASPGMSSTGAGRAVHRGLPRGSRASCARAARGSRPAWRRRRARSSRAWQGRPADRRALVVGQRQHVQQEGLLDLGAVEEVPRLSGAISGCSGSTIVAPSSVSSTSVASTGNVFSLAFAPASGSSGDAKRPAPSRRNGSVESKLAEQGLGAATIAGERSRVVDAERHRLPPLPFGREPHDGAQASCSKSAPRLGRELRERRGANETRRSSASWRGRSPAGSGARRRARASGPASATPRSTRQSRLPRWRPRRPAGRRCRTGRRRVLRAAARVRDRARSPPTAASRRASRSRCVTTAPRGRASSMRSTHASNECRPWSRRYRSAARRCPPGGRPSCGPGSDGASSPARSRPACATSSCTTTAPNDLDAPVVAAHQDRAAEVERRAAPRRRAGCGSSARPRPRGRTSGHGQREHRGPGEGRHERRRVRPHERVRRRRPALGLAEHVDEPLARGRVVVAARGSTLIWAVSAIVKISRSLGSLTPSLKRSVGAAASSTTSTPSTANSGVTVVAAAAGCRSASSRAPRSSAAKNSATASSIALPPEMPSQRDLIMPDELVAAVDRHDRVARRLAQPVDDQRLDLGLELRQHRVRGDELVPGREVQLALGRPRRARVERDDRPGRARAP